MIYLVLLLTFFKIGLFTFGGGYAMLPLIQEEVAKHAWISAEDMTDFIAVSESTPGPFAINMATYIGTELGGVLGALSATLGVVLPSFIVILLVARFYVKFRSSKVVSGVMTGLKPAAIGLIGAAVISIGRIVFAPNGYVGGMFAKPSLWLSAVLYVSMFFLALKKKLHPIIIILISAAVGLICGVTVGI